MDLMDRLQEILDLPNTPWLRGIEKSMNKRLKYAEMATLSRMKVELELAIETSTQVLMWPDMAATLKGWTQKDGHFPSIGLEKIPEGWLLFDETSKMRVIVDPNGIMVSKVIPAGEAFEPLDESDESEGSARAL